jgi:hypothetical protein
MSKISFKCETYVMEHCALFWILYHDLSINAPCEYYKNLKNLFIESCINFNMHRVSISSQVYVIWCLYWTGEEKIRISLTALKVSCQ